MAPCDLCRLRVQLQFSGSGFFGKWRARVEILAAHRFGCLFRESLPQFLRSSLTPAVPQWLVTSIECFREAWRALQVRSSCFRGLSILSPPEWSSTFPQTIPGVGKRTNNLVSATPGLALLHSYKTDRARIRILNPAYGSLRGKEGALLLRT
jgi:hypothetical protein